MEITKEQYEKIAHLLPRQRGNVKYENLAVLNAVIHIMENRCKWRKLPTKYGDWRAIYTRLSRWNKAGVLERIFSQMQKDHIFLRP